MTRAGTPAATLNGGTARVTTAPAPTIERSPTSAMTVLLLMIETSSPMRIGRRS